LLYFVDAPGGDFAFVDRSNSRLRVGRLVGVCLIRDGSGVGGRDGIP
jgi:hypothetical protein